MALVHSTNRSNLPEIRENGLLLSKANPVEGMEIAAVWLFDSGDQSAMNRYHLSPNVLIEVNRADLERDLLHAYYSVPEHFRKDGSRPNAYQYHGDVGPKLLRIYGDEAWGIPAPEPRLAPLSRIKKWFGLA